MTMTKTALARKDRLMPNGIPRWIRIYDDEGKTCDRYTVVFTGKGYTVEGYPGFWHMYIGMSAAPYHPQGICQHGEENFLIDAQHGKWPPSIGRKCHLGRRIRFQDLPKDCQRITVEDYKEYWGIKP